MRSDNHARIADALGATESIFPERESALGLASRLTSGRLLQYVQLGNQFGIQEMPVPDRWHGKTRPSNRWPTCGRPDAGGDCCSSRAQASHEGV
ncbi:hypothetical protein [Archangium sp.]|uniref:hypothetical protein n=1 Tax=Archangium sp. TaxID=1872627 RepID=UPI002D65C53D|nr:hypothetical protein [Archangium sp.]HYO55372.1 hypothetical protein [Archangium sp.]